MHKLSPLILLYQKKKDQCKICLKIFKHRNGKYKYKIKASLDIIFKRRSK